MPSGITPRPRPARRSWSVLESNIVARHGRLGYRAMACVYYGIGPGAPLSCAHALALLTIERRGPVAQALGEGPS
jgi:hypothetical protein